MEWWDEVNLDPEVQKERSSEDMSQRPQIQLRFRDQAQHERIRKEAEVAGVSLNEYILRKLESPKLDLSRRKVS
jgi:predicted HicB family RNase H-like nuclease